jgi:hypothetical protein
MSIFINSSHLEWRAGLSDTILKGTHPHQAKNRKKGDDILKNSSLMKLLSQSQPNFTEMIQNCVRHFRPPTKLAATAELNLTPMTIPSKFGSN